MRSVRRSIAGPGRRAAGGTVVTRPSPRSALLALGPELVQVGRPVRAARRVRGAAAVPAADARDRLLAMTVLVDDVPQRLGLAVAKAGSGKREGSAVHGDSWALGPRSTRARPRGTR